MRQTSLLVCAGKDNISLDGVGHTYLKVYDLDKPGKKGEPGTFVRTSRLTLPSSSNITTVNCLAVHDNLNLAAVGFSNNCLLLLRGDITRDRGTKQKLLLEGSSTLQGSRGGSSRESDNKSGISGISFKSSSRISWLYVATTDRIMVFNVSTRDKEIATQLDNIGCPSG